MSRDSPDPEELVARIRAGDPDAEKLLIETYGRRLLVLLRCWVKDAALVDDVYQQTFMTVLLRLRDRGIDEPKKLANFINRTAKFVHLGMIRPNPVSKTYANTDMVNLVPDASDGPLQQALKRENSRCVRELLEELPLERDREVLRRFYVKEETKKEICKEMNLSPANFDRVISRARQRYRKIVESHAPELGPEDE